MFLTLKMIILNCGLILMIVTCKYLLQKQCRIFSELNTFQAIKPMISSTLLII